MIVNLIRSIYIYIYIVCHLLCKGMFNYMNRVKCSIIFQLQCYEKSWLSWYKYAELAQIFAKYHPLIDGVLGGDIYAIHSLLIIFAWNIMHN